MSRIGNRPIETGEDVSIEINGRTVTVKGPRGEASMEVEAGLRLRQEEGAIVLERADDSKDLKSKHGLFRSLIGNMVEGVEEGYTKKLEIRGIGYRAAMNSGALRLDLGFSHPIFFVPPEEIAVSVDADRNNTVIVVEGIDKQVVGQIAAKIRSLRPPEPYKGKGIRYLGENVRRKAGKAAVRA